MESKAHRGTGDMPGLPEAISRRDAAVQLRRQAVRDGDIQKCHADWRCSA